MTRSQSAYDFVRSRIESGDFTPGQRLKIRELAKSLSSSDIPVREAIQRLAAEGYIVYTPHVGAVVADVPLDEALQLVLMNAILEGVITRLAAPHISPDMLEQLHALLDEQKSAVAHGDPDRYLTLDLRLHDALMSACPIRALVETAASIAERADRKKPFSLFKHVPNRMEKSVLEHEALLAKLDERPLQLDQIEALARSHKLTYLLLLGSDDLAREARRANLMPDLLARSGAPT